MPLIKNVYLGQDAIVVHVISTLLASVRKDFCMFLRDGYYVD